MNFDKAVIDLFAGGGGLSLGLIQAGMKIIAALERGPDAAATYWYNLCLKGWSHLMVNPKDEVNIKKFLKYCSGATTDNPVYELPDNNWLTNEKKSPCLNLFMMDIQEIDVEAFMEDIGLKPGELGAIVGGPPCQGFSTSNPNRMLEDPRNECVNYFLNWCNIIRPKIFLFENVPGILSIGKKKGDKEGPMPIAIRNKAGEYGYVFQYDVHNAADYGVPQNRRRVFFVGIREDLYRAGKRFKMPEPTHNWDYFEELENGSLQFDFERKEPYVTVFEAIGDLQDCKVGAVRVKDMNKHNFGDIERISSDYTESEPFDYAGKRYYKDKLNGLYGYNHMINGFWNEQNRREHFTTCIHCGKINLKIRKKCHYCGLPKSLHLPENEVEIHSSFQY